MTQSAPIMTATTVLPNDCVLFYGRNYILPSSVCSNCTDSGMDTMQAPLTVHGGMAFCITWL